ncbi:ABC-type lipoprotein export system, ATPase component [Actinopolymorpha cephalotaxi]|uniref:ABC-type lipoprotein export system ATPase subunit n=1 Tax=Actinopolymorpha cephalotaxi TaxID=504797 RepID=A0A1I2N606_9ACTN|nr:ABC transporter ATP-binding protein [Actinopolymorpha cephalotaxi]NYH85692.1 ABC-type lipoprotein export system ATPase subunit [Actinopolymorpha cephalotaxi]SFF98540.1 ABC-type lipoprotein export system, ATPase component [Actinopolymorpha cephalotaxi]
MTVDTPAVLCERLTHVYRDDEGTEVTALNEVELRVRQGEAVALVGPSGAGKSTLLTLLAGLVRPTSGRIAVDGENVVALSERGLLRLRARKLGMVLQTPGRNVLPYATARQNVAFAQRSGTSSRAERRAEAGELLESVGLDEYADRPARLLSGGQQQRLALAVALAGRPALLLADEPTSQLDRGTGDAVIALMLAARERRGTALVVVTHDRHVSDALDTEYAIHDGRLEPGAGAWLRSGSQGRPGLEGDRS